MSTQAGTLIIAPDRTERGSRGRVYLQFENAQYQGKRFRAVGSFHGGNRHVLLVAEGEAATHTVTPRNQLWWKRGVEDLGLTHSYAVTIREVTPDVLVVELLDVLADRPAVSTLPPYQPLLFPEDLHP